jgi:maleate isomerase
MAWRGKLGIVYPADGALDSEYWKWTPEGVSVHINRFPAEDDQRVEVFEAQADSSDIENSANELSVIEPDAIAYACTSGSFIHGRGKDSEIIERMEEKTGILSTTSSTAIVRALTELNVEKTAVAAPYPDEVNARLKAYLEDYGFEVVSIQGLGLESGIFSQSTGTAYKLGREANREEAEAVVISCTNFKTFEVLEYLERDIGKPVVSANQATTWDLLRLAGAGGTYPGRGRLFGGND